MKITYPHSSDYISRRFPKYLSYPNENISDLCCEKLKKARPNGMHSKSDCTVKYKSLLKATLPVDFFLPHLFQPLPTPASGLYLSSRDFQQIGQLFQRFALLIFCRLLVQLGIQHLEDSNHLAESSSYISCRLIR